LCCFVSVACADECVCSYFIKEGSVSEQGTHDQLLARKGDYYEFVQLQALSRRD
jgi:ATP-binding cassette subfamily B (MDR/TAP) protein 1